MLSNTMYNETFIPSHAKHKLTTNIIANPMIEHTFTFIPTLSLLNFTDMAKAKVDNTVTAVQIVSNTQFSSALPI